MAATRWNFMFLCQQPFLPPQKKKQSKTNLDYRQPDVWQSFAKQVLWPDKSPTSPHGNRKHWTFFIRSQRLVGKGRSKTASWRAVLSVPLIENSNRHILDTQQQIKTNRNWFGVGVWMQPIKVRSTQDCWIKCFLGFQSKPKINVISHFCKRQRAAEIHNAIFKSRINNVWMHRIFNKLEKCHKTSWMFKIRLETSPECSSSFLMTWAKVQYLS